MKNMLFKTKSHWQILKNALK